MDKVAQTRRALRAEFPGWNILYTDRQRWWATRGPKPGTQVNNGASALDADTPEQLRELLRQVTGEES